MAFATLFKILITMCLYPRLMKNKRYMPTKKNGGNVPVLDDIRKETIEVPCGVCLECMQKKARGWKIRLYEEIKNDKSGLFITLTFSNKFVSELYDKKWDKLNDYDITNKIAKLAVRRFLMRWIKKYKKSVKHWFVTELGSSDKTERVHLHGFLFTDKSETEINELWKYGHIYIGDFVNNKSINYIMKYLTKQDIEHRLYKPIVLCSKGIGKNYIYSANAENNVFKGYNTRANYFTEQGVRLDLPTYYKNNLYTEEQRDILFTKALDENKGYVMKIEYDLSRDEQVDEYYKALVDGKDINNRLGYRNPESDEEIALRKGRKFEKKLKYLEDVRKLKNNL